MNDNLSYKIFCHFCFEEFEVDLEIGHAFAGKTQRFTIASCAVTQTSYRMRLTILKSAPSSLVMGMNRLSINLYL